VIQRRHPDNPTIVLSQVTAPGIPSSGQFADIGGGIDRLWACFTSTSVGAKIVRLSVPTGGDVLGEWPAPGVAPCGIGGK
jgi:hypothetical protein